VQGDDDVAGKTGATTPYPCHHCPLETDCLRIVQGACSNLLREASLYRYCEDPTDCRSEAAADDHNHALDALRYVVSGIDGQQMARMKGKARAGDPATEGR
jgi:hypothetical protein